MRRMCMCTLKTMLATPDHELPLSHLFVMARIPRNAISEIREASQRSFRRWLQLIFSPLDIALLGILAITNVFY